MRASAFLAAFLFAGPALAIDTVNLTGDDKPVVGEITEVTRDHVTVTTKVSGDVKVETSRIASIEFEGAPPELKLARTAEESGRTEEALTRLETVLGQVGDNDTLRATVQFLIARAKARAGLTDEATRGEAIDAMGQFVDANRSHYRYYDSQLWLGRLKAAAGDYSGAKVAFDQVAKSPYREHQMAAQVSAADAQFQEGNVDEAAAAYGEVAGITPKTPNETSRRLAALLGKAKVEVAKQQYDAAIGTLDEVIRNTRPEDTAVQAEAYLRQGDAYAAQGNQAKAAVMAYLHVDVIPSLSNEKASHAEALYQLSKLWPAVGHAERGAEAAARLQELYPGSEWTKKLAG